MFEILLADSVSKQGKCGHTFAFCYLASSASVMTLLKKFIPLPLASRKNLLRLCPKPQSEFQISSESCAILRIAFEG